MSAHTGYDMPKAPPDEWGSAPRCPSCGYVENDAWEYTFGPDDDVIASCASCGDEMLVSRMITVKYRTQKTDSK